MTDKKYKNVEIKLYSNQFEIHKVDGRPVSSSQGVWVGTTTEILVSLGIWIEQYMSLRKTVPLEIEIREAGQVILSPGSNKNN